MVRKLTVGLQSIVTGEESAVQEEGAPASAVDPKKAIREKSIVCLETGKSYKILTRKHLAKLGMTPDEYREKWGYKKGTPLVCKALQRERRKKMREMQLWEKRRKPVATQEKPAAKPAGTTRPGPKAAAKPAS